ncbi:MAG: tRNA glutamyl-Q(34) synthetase GluQRS [Alphaproteobacteria bacterium]|nr:MAG: tRNA glutamyl-Q(34) synthetase GluQRS [Alphaproteobacteria bacterium]
MPEPFVTRFAPSPTGRLHLGHAYSALLAHDAARAAGGRFILRIEDIDQARCRDAFVDGIYEDLAWLELRWEEPVRRQSRHMDDYKAALATLDALGLLYPCFCTRKDIQAEIAHSPTAPHGPAGALYPGLCRALAPEIRATRIAEGAPHALRLDVGKAIAHLQARARWPRHWQDSRGQAIMAMPESLGDVVLARKDMPTSYHLAVTVDDAAQGITDIVRGADLFHATHVHVLLQALLGLPTPRYRHHRLLVDAQGQRLAKRRGGISLHALRADGMTPAQIRARLGL